MEQRISLVTLGVRELKRARAFYEGLGWQAQLASEEVVFFQLNGMVLALFSRKALVADARLPHDTPGFGGIALAWNARSRVQVETALAEAVAAGAQILKPAQDTEWGGYAGYFSDPDGHLWEVAWNPHWPLADDGSVRIP